MPPGCFGFQYPSKFMLVFLVFASLGRYAYGSFLMIGHRRLAVDQRTMNFTYVLFTLTACTVSHLWKSLIPSPYCSATRIRISILISVDSCDDDRSINAALDALHELMVLSRPFSKAAAEGGTSESDPMDFDNKVAGGITHLDIFPNLFHKVDFSSLARCSRHWLPILATFTSESADNGSSDKELGISHDRIADNATFPTRSSHGVWQP